MHLDSINRAPKIEPAVSFEPFVLQTFAIYFWKWQKIPKKLWRRVSSVPPVPPGLHMTQFNDRISETIFKLF